MASEYGSRQDVRAGVTGVRAISTCALPCQRSIYNRLHGSRQTSELALRRSGLSACRIITLHCPAVAHRVNRPKTPPMSQLIKNSDHLIITSINSCIRRFSSKHSITLCRSAAPTLVRTPAGSTATVAIADAQVIAHRFEISCCANWSPSTSGKAPCADARTLHSHDIASASDSPNDSPDQYPS